MGHREEKQRQQREAIIANTVALMSAARSGAVSDVRVREIAQQSGVSEATFFNYFASKDAVLREWAEARLDAVFAEAADRHVAGTGLRRAARWLGGELAQRIEADGPLLVDALRLLRLEPEVGPLEPRPGGTARPVPGRPRRPSGARRLVDSALARGELRRDRPVEELAGMLRATAAGALVRGLALDAEPPGLPALAARVRDALDVVLDGMRRRNERVRAPVAGPIATAPPAGT